jgi:hypothetical protein
VIYGPFADLSVRVEQRCACCGRARDDGAGSAPPYGGTGLAAHAHSVADVLVEELGDFFRSRKHKNTPTFIGRASAAKNIFSKSLGRKWARRPGLGPHRRLWSVGTAEAKGRPGAEPSDLWDELPELLRFRSS